MRTHIFSLIPVRLPTSDPGSVTATSTTELRTSAMRGFPVCLPPVYTSWFCMFQFCVCLDAAIPSLGASALSLESTFSCVGSSTSCLGGNNQARAAAAVPSPLWREKHRNVAQMKAQQPVKVVRTYRGTKAKFRNWGRQTELYCASFLHWYE